MLPEALRDFVGTTENVEPSPLADMLVELCHEFDATEGNLGIALAAAFDLYVASGYYEYVRPERWLWCEDAGLDVYQYANTCPFCVFEHEFIQHDGHKPPSGVIGSRTAAALPEIVRHHYEYTGMSDISVTSGHEPVDLAIIDEQAKKVFLAEVKASPLFTPPIAVNHSEGGLDTTGRLPEGHSIGTLRRMGQCSALLLYPDETDQPAFIELPTPGIGEDGWAANAMHEAFGRDPEAFFDYVRGWRRMWDLYLCRDDNACSTAAFWLTGGCGGPPVAGDGWPTNGRGRPQGSISDSKTSVGMDRTDDIKKGTFQVLMMGVDLHQLSLDGWELRVGLASNLHAGRHHEDYLRRYEDIAWGWLDANGKPPREWYRLFDAIVSFSRSFTEDPWLQEVLNWH